jgi:hypothetical protein
MYVSEGDPQSSSEDAESTLPPAVAPSTTQTSLLPIRPLPPPPTCRALPRRFHRSRQLHRVLLAASGIANQPLFGRRNRISSLRLPLPRVSSDGEGGFDLGGVRTAYVFRGWRQFCSPLAVSSDDGGDAPNANMASPGKSWPCVQVCSRYTRRPLGRSRRAARPVAIAANKLFCRADHDAAHGKTRRGRHGRAARNASTRQSRCKT